MYNTLTVDLSAFLENLWLAMELSLKAKGNNEALRDVKPDLSALEKLRYLSEKGYSKELFPVLKCDAYGLGAVEIGKVCFAAGLERGAVVRLSEALALRNTGLEILIMNALAEEELEEAVKNNFILTLYRKEHVDSLERVAKGLKVRPRVHVKLNTGMNRFGTDHGDFDEVYHRVRDSEYLNFSGVFSHYHNAYSDDESYTKRQFNEFQKDLARVREPIEHHLGNSAALLRYPQYVTGSSRPGIMLYGSYPSEEMFRKGRGFLRSVVELKSKVLQVRKITKGEFVGYGTCWKVEEDSLVASIPIGYGDGYRRNVTSENFVLIQGKQYPLFGNVSMDSITVLLGKDTFVKVGDEVVLFGGNKPGAPTVDETAEGMGIIPYELLTGINQRVYREYINRTVSK